MLKSKDMLVVGNLLGYCLQSMDDSDKDILVLNLVLNLLMGSYDTKGMCEENTMSIC